MPDPGPGAVEGPGGTACHGAGAAKLPPGESRRGSTIDRPIHPGGLPVRTFAGLFVGGAVTLVLFKLFAAVIMPVLAMIMGFAFSALKLVLLAVAVYVLYSIFFKRKRRRAEG